MVQAGAFSIDGTEVTIAQYQAFVAASDPRDQLAPCAWNTSFAPTRPPAGGPDNPVAYVNWCDAYAYCAWAGKRLCGRIGGGAVPPEEQGVASADQWLSACSRGGDEPFPYGSAYQPQACNGPDYGAGGTVPVGSIPTCEGGYPRVFDMSGNVGEWEDSCSSNSSNTDLCSVRSGSFHDPAARQSCASPHTETRDYSDFDIGFRCCRDG
jgi:formylglycine-generating enzyme required for sulfatase activity